MLDNPDDSSYFNGISSLIRQADPDAQFFEYSQGLAYTFRAGKLETLPMTLPSGEDTLPLDNHHFLCCLHDEVNNPTSFIVTAYPDNALLAALKPMLLPVVRLSRQVRQTNRTPLINLHHPYCHELQGLRESLLQMVEGRGDVQVALKGLVGGNVLAVKGSIAAVEF